MSRTLRSSVIIKNEQENIPLRKRKARELEAMSTKEKMIGLSSFAFKPSKQMDFFNTKAESPIKKNKIIESVQAISIGLDDEPQNEKENTETQIELQLARLKAIFAALDSVLYILYSGDGVGIQASFLQIRNDVERSCHRYAAAIIFVFFSPLN